MKKAVDTKYIGEINEYQKGVKEIILEAIGSVSPKDMRQWIRLNILLNPYQFANQTGLEVWAVLDSVAEIEDKLR